MNRAFAATCIFLCLITSMVSAQPAAENENRAVYNRLEYFFNSKQIDSIYALANEDFKKQINLGQLQRVLGHFTAYGRIHQADLVSFEQGTASYELLIGDKTALLKLAVDSNLRYGLFHMAEIQKNTIKKDVLASAVEQTDPLDVHMDSLARVYMQHAQAQSLAIGVIHNNRTRTFFYGETAPGNATLPTASTLYEIGSITKIFTATLLADMVERGIVRLEDSIAKFLPDSVAQNSALQDMTFQSLANHTSGLPRLPSNIDKTPKFNVKDPYAAYTRRDLFAFLKDFKPEAAVGEKYVYSNLGYGLLGELLAVIAKKTYGDLIREVITTPLKMTNTADKLLSKNQQLVKIYDEQGNETLPWNFQALAGAGALKSTVQDLLTYAKAQFNMPESPLEHAMALTRQFTYFLPPDTDIGLAWRMNMVDDTISYWHTGATGGCRSFIGLVPDKKSALIVLTNAAVPMDKVYLEMMKKIIATP